MHGNRTIALGTVFAGDFRLEHLLARGGMGSVYAAEQLSTGQRRALKILHEDIYKDTAMRARFEHEARVVARIQSAHVVQVIGAGVDPESGRPWICMELLEGSTFEDRYPLGVPVPPGDLSLLLSQLGHALAAAHREGIVHRDVKPENVFLARSSLVGLPFLVKLLDFGIAKTITDTKAGTMAMGSPYWMAPEQIHGQQPVSPATDVWALGLLSFRLATGQLYWRALRRGDENPLLVFHEISSGKLTPPSERLRERGSGVQLPEGFDGWFLRCMEADPRRRYPDAGAALAELLRMTPGSMPTLPSTPERPGAPPSTRPAPASRPAAPPTSPSRPRTLLLRHRQSRTAAEVLREYGEDLSIDGLRLRTRSPLPVGTAVMLDIRTADDRTVATGSGAVVEASEESMQVRFSSLGGPLVDELARRGR